MTNSYIMEIIVNNSSSHSSLAYTLGFSDYESAKKQLDLIKPLVRTEYNFHTIVSEEGELLINVKMIQSVRIIDWKKYMELMEFRDKHRSLKEIQKLAGLSYDAILKEVQSKVESKSG